MRRLRLALATCALLGLSLRPPPMAPAAATRPFGLPFAGPPGPSTWLVVQFYGNTTTAYRWRVSQYGNGQGLHFGVDFAARCGTPVLAVGDGVVSKIDATQHGAGPHNLMVDHPDGHASFYGHLLHRPELTVGQKVTRGQAVALSGDPDLTCTSRPHLHLEIRTIPGYARALNPALYIEADWDGLALAPDTFGNRGLAGGGRGFERSLDDPRRWQFLDDQPEITFGGPLLNDYPDPWPPDWSGP